MSPKRSIDISTIDDPLVSLSPDARKMLDEGSAARYQELRSSENSLAERIRTFAEQHLARAVAPVAPATIVKLIACVVQAEGGMHVAGECDPVKIAESLARAFDVAIPEGFDWTAALNAAILGRPECDLKDRRERIARLLVAHGDDLPGDAEAQADRFALEAEQGSAGAVQEETGELALGTFDPDAGVRSGWGSLEDDLAGIDPLKPTEFTPGSENKVLLLGKRYQAGAPLWIKGDNLEYALRVKEAGEPVSGASNKDD